MNKQAIFDHYTKLLDNMIDKDGFWAIYFQDPFSLYNERDIPFPVFTGVSRGCYVDNSYPYVIKWQLTGDTQECEHEEEVYNAACGMGFEKYLVEPIYLGVYTRNVYTYNIKDYLDMSADDQYPKASVFQTTLDMMEDCGYVPQVFHLSVRLWAYPRATKPKDFWTRSYSNEIQESAEETECDEYPLSQDPIIACCWIEELGKEKYIEFNEFLYEYDVNDLHGGNIMFLNGHPVIIDYAGVAV